MKQALTTALMILYSSTVFAQVSITKGTYILDLPRYSGYQSTFTQYNELNHSLSRATSRNSSIEIYDLNRGSLMEEIRLENNEKIGAFTNTSANSFWIFNPTTRILKLYNHEGHKLKTANELKSANTNALYTSYYAELNYSPPVLFKNRLLLIASLLRVPGKVPNLENYNSLGMIRCYNLKTGNFSWIGSIPESLKRFDFGYLNRFSSTRKGDSLVIAPYFSDEICVFDMGSMSIESLPNENPTFTTEPYAKFTNNSVVQAGNTSLKTHYSKSPYYISILYDKYKDVYYRILLTPRGNFNKYKIRVVILNPDFSFRNSYCLPMNYNHNGIFVSKKGLNLINHDAYIENTNQLQYDTFTFNE